MIRKKVLLGMLVSVTIALIAIAETSYAGSTNCEDLLVGNRYRCEITFPGDSGVNPNPAEGCVNVIPDDVPGVFNLESDTLRGECSCKAKRRFLKPPLFNEARSFLCQTTQVTGELGDSAVDGKVYWGGWFFKGNGRIFSENTFLGGKTFVYKCVKDPDCVDNG